MLLALLVGLGAWLFLGDPAGDGSESPPTSASADTSASGEAFLFDPQAYIGSDYREVQAQLEAANLSVTAEPATADQLAAGGIALDANDVAATDPGTAGPLEPGSDVVLYFAEQEYAPTTAEETETPATTSEAPSSTSQAATTSSAPPSSSSAAATTSSSAPATTSSSASAPATSVSPPPTPTTGSPVASPANEEPG